MTKRRVVITGLGLMTPCGNGWQPYWQAALHRESRIRQISGFSMNGFPARYAGQITEFDCSSFIKNKKSLKLMSREIQLAVAAGHLAVEDAALTLTETDRERFGISMGTGIINNDLDEIGVGIRTAIGEDGKFHMSKFGAEGIRALYPLWFLKYLPNMPACHLSIALGLRGPSNTVTTSSAASTQAIGEAYQVIRRDDADLMLAGGTDSKINAMGISRLHLLGLLSVRNSILEDGYCPFDERHDGIVLGEGAGLLVLEEYEHAKKRGARIYGEITGYGSSSDFNYDPRGDTHDFNGKRVAMTRALESSSIPASDIDFLFANGSGIPAEDIQEARAIEKVFENCIGNLKITATKPITGHLVYGAGGVEMAAATLALHRGIVPPLAYMGNPAPECDLPFIKDIPAVIDAKTCMINSFGFCGQNASLVVQR